LVVAEDDLGWVVKPGEPGDLAEAIRVASGTAISPMAACAVAVAGNFGRDRAMADYRRVAAELLRQSEEGACHEETVNRLCWSPAPAASLGGICCRF
jgi:hypothetical protein